MRHAYVRLCHALAILLPLHGRIQLGPVLHHARGVVPTLVLERPRLEHGAAGVGGRVVVEHVHDEGGVAGGEGGDVGALVPAAGGAGGVLVPEVDVRAVQACGEILE